MVVQSLSANLRSAFLLCLRQKRQEGFPERFKAFRILVRTELLPVQFPADNKLCKPFRDLDERRPFPTEVEPEELHERRAVVEPGFTQNPPEGGMGNTFQDGLAQSFFRPGCLC